MISAYMQMKAQQSMAEAQSAYARAEAEAYRQAKIDAMPRYWGKTNIPNVTRGVEGTAVKPGATQWKYCQTTRQ